MRDSLASLEHASPLAAIAGRVVCGERSSATTRDALGAGFTTRERGTIDVKGRGPLTTYWLDHGG